MPPSNAVKTNPQSIDESQSGKNVLMPSRDIAVLLEVMKRLREGCPWDKVQTFDTIAPYTIEEAYEVASAIADKDFNALPRELGDLLLQVDFTPAWPKRTPFGFGAWSRPSPPEIRRHPHVFGDEQAKADATGQKDLWEKLKESERTAAGQTSLLDDVASALPALTRAEKLQRRASSVGFDWNNPALVLDKLAEEAREVLAAENPDEREDEIGDLLFVVANLARHLNVDPEAALRRTNAKFVRRFRHIEDTLGPYIGTASLEEMEALWLEAKVDEKPTTHC